MLLAYSASYEFFTDDKECRSTMITYLAPNEAEAMKAAVRFWKGRNENLPDWFNKILCVKIYLQAIGEIEADGTLQTRLGFRLMEWKYDTAGMELEEFVEYMAQKFAR